MKIIDNRKTPSVKKFENILVGECFIDDDGDITIKVFNKNILEISAVCLKSGEQWFPFKTREYQIVSASVVIEE